MTFIAAGKKFSLDMSCIKTLSFCFSPSRSFYFSQSLIIIYSHLIFCKFVDCLMLNNVLKLVHTVIKFLTYVEVSSKFIKFKFKNNKAVTINRTVFFFKLLLSFFVPNWEPFHYSIICQGFQYIQSKFQFNIANKSSRASFSSNCYAWTLDK